MANLEITDTPSPKRKKGEPTFSQRILEAANRVEYASWEVAGVQRRVGVRAPRGADGLRLARVLTADEAQKPTIFNQAMLAFCVAEIDGTPVPRPASALQLEAILDRLGFEGIKAAGEAFERVGRIDGLESDPKN